MEEFHAKIGEIFGLNEATTNNPENMEISAGGNIAFKMVASQCAELNTRISSDCPFIECMS
jgi:hypothetical protein